MRDSTAATMNYERTRGLMLLVGLIILLGVAIIMYVRRVDPTEVSATLFFLPVFMGFLYFGIRGGLTVGAMAAVGYVLLRLPAVEAVGLERFLGLMITRTLGYLAFGGFGGWATQQLTVNMTKLDQYDEVDDATKLNNSRGFVDTLVRERTRAQRYDEVFSVVFLETQLSHVDRRGRADVLKALGQAIHQGVRSVDYAFHAVENGTDVFAAVLPETGSAGAATFANKLNDVVSQILLEHGVPVEAPNVVTASFPEDEATIETMLERAQAIFKVDFPEASPVG